MSTEARLVRISNDVARLWTRIGAFGVPGEINTASNTGSSGTGVFKQKTGVDLEFYKLNSIHAGIVIALDGTDKVDFDIDESGIDHNSLLNYLASEHFTMLDEDDFASESDTEAATQQSIKNYVDNSLNALFDFFLTDTASDIATYFRMQDVGSGGIESSFLEAGLGVGDDQLVDVWATPSGEPGANQLIPGIYDAHFHAERTVGTRTLQFYWTLSTRTDPGGVETLRMTSEVSGAVTAKTDITLHAALSSDIVINTSDRLVFKIYANISGGGANVSLAVYAEGDTDSHITIPVTTGILSGIFVRRDGTVDLTGSWTIATDSITLSAGTMTARVLATGDAVNAGTLNIWDGSAHKQILTTPALAADVPFQFPNALDVGKFLKCGAAGLHTWDVPGGGGGAPVGASYLVLGLNGDLTAERVFVPRDDVWAADEGVNDDYHLTTGIIHKTTTTDPPDDRFEDAAIDVRWTITDGAEAAVGLLATDGGNIDMTTVPTKLLLQAENADLCKLRQDYTLPDGNSITLAGYFTLMSNATTGILNNELQVGIALNDNDTDWNSGNWIALFFDAGTNNDRILFWDGATVHGTTSVGTDNEVSWCTSRMLFRICRSGNVYYGFWSTSGETWMPLGSVDMTGEIPSNVWIFTESTAAFGTPNPIQVIDWILLGDNDFMPW